MKILHTGDWHVGRLIRGRSRSDEHEAVLAEIAAIARSQNVDLVIVAGDVFDSGAPSAESERVAYRALLALAETGAAVVVLSGNHDNDRRLQAIAPVLGLGRIVTRAGFDPELIEGTTAAGERWRMAAVPFLSQRWVVSGADLIDESKDAADHSGAYAARIAGLLAAVAKGFTPDAVNLIAAHLHVAGGVLGGGERLAHTIFEYAVSAAAFPSTAHYVALGHLHRAQLIAGPCPIRYAGSPLQLDFGEVADVKSVTLVTAVVGKPAGVQEIPLTAGRRLRTVTGSLADLAGIDAGDDWLKVVVTEKPRVGLADEVRALLPTTVDVVIASPADGDVERVWAERAGRSPHELFAAYLTSRGVDDRRLVALFDRLVDQDLGPDRLGGESGSPGTAIGAPLGAADVGQPA